jgi:hypothetical protein
MLFPFSLAVSDCFVALWGRQHRRGWSLEVVHFIPLSQLIERVFEAGGKRAKLCGDEWSDESRWVLHAGVLI